MPRYLKTTSSLIAVASLAMFLAGTHAVLGQDEAASPDETEDTVPFALPKSGPFNPADIEIKNDQSISDWFRSAHADAAAEAFRHWDEEEEITAVCATCHSGEGFRDYHGLDGTAAGSVEGPINTGGVVDCGTCHNAGLAEIEEVAFPSGLMHPVQGVEASCMTCHQGRTAGSTVVKAMADLDLDTPNSELRFINPHYATAAATWLGGYGGSGYHYDGKDYSGRFFHARPVSSCVSCHEPHTLEVAFEPCLTCHQANEPEDIRIARQSYDGSGDTNKGIKSDIQTNAATLLDMIKDYAADVAGTPIVYDGTRYPYFFTDANGDGVADQSDGQPVAYNAWTPRSLRATYNWKLVTADPGNYAHNPPYMLELLYDSIEDLSGPLGTDMQALGLLR
ncbi:cytochrome c3 family protein [uncultured Marivita sp.]|uniref:cytochrome c3 family protein n=1 Tax=uncultured Marivita sp. TaxID=888080 RepID=UPI00262EAA24|nr:cytochrome c3 family protein [uncultured Marivita sp.]